MEFLGAVDLEAVTLTDKVIVEKADNHRSKQTLSCKPGSKATTLTRQVISLRLAEISCQVIRMEARSCRYYTIRKSSGWNSIFHKMPTTSIVISVLPDLSAAQQVNSYNKFQDDRLS